MCPFCPPDPSRVWHDGELVLGLWDGFPVAEGHALLVPRRHCATWFDATPDEQSALLALISAARGAMAARGLSPDGYNVGFNSGAAAGQTVDHLHVHVIPRYSGDVPDPRGGVRWVVPERADYWTAREAVAPFVRDPTRPHGGLSAGGRDDRLLPILKEELGRSRAADIAVAFVARGGLALLLDDVRSFLARGGRLRFVTGDYLDVTDPDALTTLLALEGARDLRVYETRGVGSFHPKSYTFERADGSIVAYVGSSNLTSPGLDGGVEWNLSAVSSADGAALRQVRLAFEDLLRDPSVRALDAAWIEDYRLRREPRPPVEVAHVPPAPWPVQEEALAALRQTRAEGNTAGLVVLATGLGKTLLAAFDSAEHRRILFVAHREELLDQAERAFRRVRGSSMRRQRLGGKGLAAATDVTFATVQALSRPERLARIAPDAFDYIVIDEFHHAAAPTYRRIIQHFDPEFLLGLTATPSRADGADLLALCGHNLVYECDLFAGSARDFLCKVRYFGIADTTVDYAAIPWRSGKFDPASLEAAVATQVRAQDAYDQWRSHPSRRTLGFCASIRHADFMRGFFQSKGVRAAAVHAAATSDGRQAVDALRSGEIDVLFSVDMFNEGLDVPEVDSVLMLRPTESETIFLQQLGRGLRRDPTSPDKTLVVLDYIGNHRSFLAKARLLARAASESVNLDDILVRATRPLRLSPSFELVFELEAIDILRKLAAGRRAADADLVDWYVDFRQVNGRRPTATEALHAGHDPKRYRRAIAAWVDFVASQGDLPFEPRLSSPALDFLRDLETTSMTRSFKPAVIVVMAAHGAMPGSMSLESLTAGFSQLAHRTPRLRDEVTVNVDDAAELKAYLVKNPLGAWSGAAGGEAPHFSLTRSRFATTFRAAPLGHAELASLAQELAEYRLASYFATRSGRDLRPRNVQGVPLDATFEVEGLGPGLYSVRLKSRGGAKAGAAYNTQYTPALDLLLARLGAMNGVLEAVDLDTLEEQRPLDVGRALPVPLSTTDAVALRSAIARSQGRNSTRTIRLRVAGLPDDLDAVKQVLVTGRASAPAD